MQKIKKIKSLLRPAIKKTIHICHIPGNIYNYQRILYRIQKNHADSKKIHVLFIIQFPEMWNTVKTVYKAFCDDDHYEATVVTVPKTKVVNTRKGGFCDNNEASVFCDKENIPYIELYKDEKWCDIKSVKPDIIFIQRPYDDQMPKYLSMHMLSINSLVCYIPYGYEFVNNIHLDIEYNSDFLDAVYCCFAENNNTKKYISSVSKFYCRLGIRKIYNVGYPRFDLVNTVKQNQKFRRNIIWTPRWSISDSNDRGHFVDYFECLYKYFSKNKELNLIIRPHPLMFINYLSTGFMSQQEIDELKKRVDDAENISWDNNKDYLLTFEKCDLLISDFSSLVIEFYATNKPIIYCNDTGGFNYIGKKMEKGLYLVKNSEELISNLDFLVKNYDIHFDYNSTIISKFIKNKSNIGENIKNVISENYLKKQVTKTKL